MTSSRTALKRAGLQELFSLARSELSALIVATICLLVAAALNLALPQLIGQLVDTLVDPKLSVVEARAHLNQSVLYLIALFAGVGLATWARAYLFTIAGERIVLRLRQRLFTQLLNQEQTFFDTTHSAQWVGRLADDTAQIQRAVTVNLSMLLRYLIGAIGALVILAFISFQLTLIMGTVVPVTAGAAAIYGRFLRSISREVQDGLASANELAGEALGGVQTVRALDASSRIGKHYQSYLEQTYQKAKRRAQLGAYFQGGMSFASYAAIGAVIWYGGQLTLQGDLTLGDLTSFLLYTFTLAFSIGALSGLWEDFSRALGSTEVVFELLQRDNQLPSGHLSPSHCYGQVEFNSVSFTYPARPDIQVLHSLNFEIQSNQTIALVGQSGSGKSTVAALLQRMYDPTEGLITLDDYPLAHFDTHWLRTQIAVVSQEPLLFATTIEENLRLANPSASFEQLVEATHSAQAHDFIMSFPNGYQTMIGERGLRLSGGQRQRIAIARALLRDPKVLILDEATSALDAESEEAVQQALNRLKVGRSTLMIAHRLSTVRDADQIIVIENGQAIERGSHAELLSMKGRYAELVSAQLTLPFSTKDHGPND